MKRVIALLLCLVLSLSLCACGVQPDTGKPDGGSQGGDQNAQGEGNNQQEDRKPASEEFLTQLYGTWNGERWDDFAPVALIAFNADGTCIADGQNLPWYAWQVSDTSIELEIRQGEKAVIGGRLSKLLAGEEVYYELRLWDATADGIGPAPDYSKQGQTQ